jgi:predicted nucleotidyltransferase
MPGGGAARYTRGVSRESRREALERVCRAHGVLAAYLFGSRADDGLRLLAGEAVARQGSDLDVGIVFPGAGSDLQTLVRLQLGLDEVFEPLRLDVVPLQRVDAIFQARAIDGHRVFAADSTEADLYELLVLRRAAELLPLQRARELELFGVSTS